MCVYIYMWDIQKQQMGCSMGSQWNKDEEKQIYRSPQVEDIYIYICTYIYIYEDI